MSETPYVLRLDVGPTREEWCDECLTASLVACDITRITSEGVSVMATYRKCWRCGVTSKTEEDT